jgi:hypothetical protein
MVEEYTDKALQILSKLIPVETNFVPFIVTGCDAEAKRSVLTVAYRHTE